MAKFKVGEEVRLKKGVYLNAGDNPIGILGTITELRDNTHFIYRVQWDNGWDNVYHPTDLCKKVKDTKIARLIYKDDIDKIEGGWLWLKQD